MPGYKPSILVLLIAYDRPFARGGNDALEVTREFEPIRLSEDPSSNYNSDILR